MLLTNRKRRENEQNKQICKAPEQAEASAIPDDPSKIEFVDVTKIGAKKTKKRDTAKKSEYEKLPKPSIRFDGLKHVPNFNQGDDRKAHRCKFEGCDKRTPIYCEKCNVHLCLLPGQKGRNCFKEFHELNSN